MSKEEKLEQIRQAILAGDDVDDILETIEDLICSERADAMRCVE